MSKEEAEVKAGSEEEEDAPVPQHPPPIDVLYCAVCGVPPEYCPYGPDWDRCKVWIAETCPELMPVSEGVTVARAAAGVAGLSLEGGEAGGAGDGGDEPALASSSKKGGRKKKKSAKADPALAAALISVAERKKRKFITSLVGIDSFNLKPKDVAKKLGRKFATSASLTRTPENAISIEIGGDVSYELPEFLTEEFDIPEDKMFRVDKTGKRTPINEY